MSEECTHNHHHHHHHHHDCGHHHYDYSHKCADCCDDQLPNVSKVGRGLAGDSFKIDCYDDEKDENLTYLIGKKFDSVTKEWTEAWRSDNINGGRLQLFYHLNPHDSPRSFTLTFVYSRPSIYKDGEHAGEEMPHKRTVWGFTTPAIPYLYTTDPDHPMMGSVVGTVFLKDHMAETDDKYKEMLTYPDIPDGIRELFDGPYPPGGKDMITNIDNVRTGDTTKDDTDHMPDGTEWNVYLDITELDELAKVTGLSREIILAIIKGAKFKIKPTNPNPDEYPYFDIDFGDVQADDLKKYIDLLLAKENKGRHEADDAIEDEIEEIGQAIININNKIVKIYKTLDDIVKKFFGGGTINEDGSITWGDNGKAAVGNLNVFSNPGSDAKAYALRTRTPDDQRGDLRFK